MSVLAALLSVRFKEAWSDKGSLIFAIVLPLALLLLFPHLVSDEEPLFVVGILKHINNQVLLDTDPELVEFLFVENSAVGKRLVKYRQIDMYVDVQRNEYWTASASPKTEILREILSSMLPARMIRKQIDGAKVRFIDWLLPGIFGMNLMLVCLIGTGYAVVRERKRLILKRLQVSPVKPMHFVTSLLVSKLLITLVLFCSVFTFANSLYDFLMLGSYLDLFFVTAIGTCSILSMALLASCRTNNEDAVSGYLNVLSFPMIFLSGIWFPLDESHVAVDLVSKIFPLTHIVSASRAIMLEGSAISSLYIEIVYLTAITIVSLALSVKLFKWQ